MEFCVVVFFHNVGIHFLFYILLFLFFQVHVVGFLRNRIMKQDTALVLLSNNYFDCFACA